jgi:hypothetical protein
MRKIIITFAALLALAVPASSGAVGSARWVTYPTCTATTTTITCTGRAAGVQPKSIEGLGTVEVALHAAVHYTCNYPGGSFGWVFSGFPLFNGGDAPENVQVTADFQNGRVFSLQYTPGSAPPGATAAAACGIPGGSWTRDPSYYNVDVRIGWDGLIGPNLPILALQAPIGTVSPG